MTWPSAFPCTTTSQSATSSADYSTGLPHCISSWRPCDGYVALVRCRCGRAGARPRRIPCTPPPFKAWRQSCWCPIPTGCPPMRSADVALAQSRTVAERAMHQLGLAQSAQASPSSGVQSRKSLIGCFSSRSGAIEQRSGARAGAGHRVPRYRAQQARAGAACARCAQGQVTQAKQHQVAQR
jgi:hypothetical protein